MAPQQSPSSDAAPGAESSVQAAEARLKAASDRHAAIVSIVSRLGASPQERRLAQSESKKVERELGEARRALKEAQGAAGSSH